MEKQGFARQLRLVVRRGLRPASPAAFAFAFLCVAAAIALRLAVDLIALNATAFATFYPAVVVSALVCGVAGGAFATLLSGLAAWWFFLPPRFEWLPLS